MEINRSELSQTFTDLFMEKLKFSEREFEMLLSHFKLELVHVNFITSKKVR